MHEADAKFYRRVFGIATAALLGFTAFKLLQPFIGIVLWAFLLAFLLFPANRLLRQKLGSRRGGAAALLTLSVLVLLVVPTFIIGAVFLGQSADLLAYLQKAAAQLREPASGETGLHESLLSLEQIIGPFLPFPIEQVQAWVVEATKRVLQFLVSASGSIFFGALGAAIGLILLLFFLFFFLRDGDDMLKRIMRLVPMDAGRKAHLLEHLAAVLQAVVLGTLLTALVQGTLLGVGFTILGLPSPIVIAVLGVLAALIPLVGTAVIWGPTALALALQNRWGGALFMVLWGVLVISSADNFIRPLFISGRARLSIFPVFVGLAGGLSAFGPIGMFLGPVVVALVIALFEFAEESLAEPPPPESNP